MSVKEVLGALGSWEVQLTDELPEEIRAKLGFFGHIALIRGRADVDAYGDKLLKTARYVGVLRTRGKGDDRTIGGSGMVLWLGDEDDKGHVYEVKAVFDQDTLFDAVNKVIPPALRLGNVYPHVDPTARFSGVYQYVTPRKLLQTICDAFQVEYRVDGDGFVYVGRQDQLYTSVPDSIVVRRGAGIDLDLVALGADFETDESAVDYSTRVLLVGQTQQDGTTFATGAADAALVPYLDLFGTPVKRTRVISETGETSGSASVRAQLHLNRFNRTTKSLKVTADGYELEGNFKVGDMTYVYDPDSGLVDAAREVYFRGEVLHPDLVRISELTWSVTADHTVAFRTQSGEWLDLTRWVVWENGSNEVVVGDLPRSLTGVPSNPVLDRVDANTGKGSDGTIPKPPTGLGLSTSSILDARGRNVAIIAASWTAPTQNTDDTALTDLSHFLVQYRWAPRAPQWESTVAPASPAEFVVAAGLPYDVQVAAVDKSGNTSAFTGVSSITSATDSAPPPAPSDPLVTSYLGQLRIEWDGLSSTGGPMPSDFNRVDVHVSATSGFTASAATLVSSLSTKGVAYATAPYAATRYVRLVAYDHAGNVSASSGQVSGSTVQVANGDIASLSVGKLTAGTMAADVVMAGRFTTALTGQRREMNAVGWQAFNASNTLTVNIDGVNNLLTGIFKTALTGRRTEIGSAGATGQIDFYAPDASRTWIRSYTSTSGREVLEFGVDDPVDVNGDNRFSIATDGTFGYFQSRFSNMDLTVGRKFNIFSAADSFGVQIFGIDGATRDINFRPGTTGRLSIWNNANTPSLQVNPQAGTMSHFSSGSSGQFFFADGSASFITNGQGKIEFATHAFGASSSPILKFFTSGGFGANLKLWNDADGAWLELKQWDDTLWYGMRAGAFTVMSDQAQKENVRALDPTESAGFLNMVKSTTVKRYKRRAQTNQEGAANVAADEIGLIAQEAPAQIVVPGQEKSIDLYQMASLLWVAVQELSTQIEDLKRGGKL